MENKTQPLPQDQPAVYQIQIEGRIDERIWDWFDDMTVTQNTEGRKHMTTLTGPVADQAALQGLLRKIYNLGFLVITVSRIDRDQ